MTTLNPQQIIPRASGRGSHGSPRDTQERSEASNDLFILARPQKVDVGCRNRDAI